VTDYYRRLKKLLDELEANKDVIPELSKEKRLFAELLLLKKGVLLEAAREVSA